MLSNAHTQPLSLLKVKANRWQTQVSTRVPGFSVSQCSVVCILDCTLMPTQSEEQTINRSRTCWHLRTEIYSQERGEDTARAQTSSEICGGFEMSFCHNVLCGLHLLSTQLLFYHQPQLCADSGTFSRGPLGD